ncbi:MAG: NAD(P)H-dependent oxidoreductase [Dysgonamonadaceae bacterium]|jgi:multimeric flavodoxin WrbA|nr:NAD(P)H-dependent oxidoreductase [Dysgonamonadaceae bacterium]
MDNTLIIHDLDVEQAQYLFGDLNNVEILSSHRKIAPCVGCYLCWLKTPGCCVYHDGIETIGRKIAMHDGLVIVSKIFYGGYSPSVKNIIDRSISTSLPSFAFRNREMHHRRRFKKRYILKVYFYNFDNNKISQEEKDVAQDIVTANSINWGCPKHETFFATNLDELKEVLK